MSAPAPRMRVNAPKGVRPSLEFRPLGDLHLDDSYQRSIDIGPSQKLVRKIAVNWDWGLCQPLIVAKRDDGSLWVVDGQHRLAAARLRPDIYDLPCVVVHSAAASDEAAMFVALNQQRRPLTALDLFRASLEAGAYLGAGAQVQDMVLSDDVVAVAWTLRTRWSALWSQVCASAARHHERPVRAMVRLIAAGIAAEAAHQESLS